MHYNETREELPFFDALKQLVLFLAAKLKLSKETTDLFYKSQWDLPVSFVKGEIMRKKQKLSNIKWCF